MRGSNPVTVYTKWVRLSKQTLDLVDGTSSVLFGSRFAPQYGPTNFTFGPATDDGAAPWICPRDTVLRGLAVTASRAMRGDFSLYLRVDGVDTLIGTVPALTDVRSTPMLFTGLNMPIATGQQMEIVFVSNGNYNMTVTAAVFLEGPQATRGGFVMPFHNSSTSTSTTRLHAGDYNGGYSSSIVAPEDLVMTGLGVSISRAFVTDTTFRVEVASADAVIFTIPAGQTHAQIDLDIPVPAGTLFNIYRAGGDSSTYRTLAMAAFEKPGAPLGYNTTFFNYHSTDSRLAGAILDGAPYVMPRAGRLTSISVGRAFSVAPNYIDLQINDGAAQRLLVESEMTVGPAYTAMSKSLDIAFEKGDRLLFTQGGTDVTGAGFNMSLGVEMLTGA